MSHRSTDGCPPAELHTQVEFSNDPPKEGSPETEFRRTPDRAFFRKFYNRRLRFPDGFETEIWSFEDERSGRRFPAPLIRAREGEIVHLTLKPSKGPHTIHLHGIEPDPRNDGVGHTSFEVSGEYTYQFRPQPNQAGNPNVGSAGTYFYHCHVNTVLHVQMGMFGALIIDPASGRGRAFADDPVGYDTRAESLLVTFEVDPRWHEMGHAAGLDGEDVGLNRFEPERFYLLGGDLNAPPPPAEDGVDALGEILATPPGHRPGLLRSTNGSYFPTLLRFGGGLQAELISHDGRPLRDTSRTPSPPVSALTSVLSFGAAERYDVRLRPPAGAKPGDEFPVAVDLIHWVTRRVVATEETVVRILEPADPPLLDPGAPIPPPSPGLPPRPADILPPASGQAAPGSSRLTGSGSPSRRRRLALDRLAINARQKRRTVRTRGVRVVTRLQPEIESLRYRVFRIKRGGRRSRLVQEFRTPGRSGLYTTRLRSRKFRQSLTLGRYELQVRPRGVTSTGRTARYVFRVVR